MASTFFRLTVSLAAVSSVFALPDNVIRFTPETVADLTSFSNTTTTAAQFQIYDDAFLPILGSNPTLSVILNSSNSSFPQFHEAAILASSNPPVFFITSNQYTYPGFNSPSTSNKTLVISRVSQNITSQEWTAEIISPTGSPIFLANGGTVANNASNLIFCAQGDLVNGGGLISMTSAAPYIVTSLINNYIGTPFNSPNDVTQTSDGALWFTDPQFGSFQSIRPAPQLPAQIYRFMPGTTAIRVVADGLSAPNGIAFSRDEKTAYITDTAKNAIYPTASSVIYAYDVVTAKGGPVLSNKRTFATPAVGIPDGIKTDREGNVYAGCGDGVNVWDVAGKLLGKVVVPGGAANFVMLDGAVVLLNEQRLWFATLSGLVVGRAGNGTSNL